MARRKAEALTNGAFRILEKLEWNKRSLQASHSCEVHQLSHIEPGGRAVSQRGGKSYPLGTIQIVARSSRPSDLVGIRRLTNAS